MSRLVFVVALVACSGHAGHSDHPTQSTRPQGRPAVAAQDGRSDEHCEKLLAHALDLALAERPADQKLDDKERSSIETQLRTSYLASCKQMTQTGYACAIAAHSVAELDGCAN